MTGRGANRVCRGEWRRPKECALIFQMARKGN